MEALFHFFFMSLLIAIKFNLSLYSLYYAERCNEFAGPVSASLRLRATAQLFLKKCRCGDEWRAFANAVSDLVVPKFELRPTALEKNALPLDEWAGFAQTAILNNQSYSLTLQKTFYNFFLLTKF